MKDIIIQAITSFIGVIGAYKVSIKLDKIRIKKDEERRVRIILDNFTNRVVAYLSISEQESTRFEVLKKAALAKQEYIIKKTKFTFQDFSRPLIDEIDKSLEYKYNLIRNFYVNDLKFGQEEDVPTQQFYKLIQNLNLDKKLENRAFQ